MEPRYVMSGMCEPNLLQQSMHGWAVQKNDYATIML